MKLNPQQAPLYGDSVLTVLLTEEDKLEDDVVFYLLFAGSTLKHLTSTKKVDSVTLKTVTPGHDCCETVKVSLCASKKGLPVLVVAEETFEFVQDEAYDAAQFLAASAGNQQALIFARFLDRSRPPLEDVSILDEKVTLAFRHLKLPEDWTVLGSGKNVNEDVPQESLMHFAVRLGLLRLAWLLLQQPGGRESLGVHNNEGATPVSLALERGFQKLHQLLTDEKASEPDAWSTLSRVIHSGDPCIRHHSGLNVYTLTESRGEGAHSSLDDDIGELRKHIQKHSQHTNATMQSQWEPEMNPGTSILKENSEQNIVTDDAPKAPNLIEPKAQNLIEPEMNPGTSILKENSEQNIVTDDAPKVPNLIEPEADVSATLSVVGITSQTFSGGNSDAEIENTVEPKILDNQLSLAAAVVAESSCDRTNIDLEAEKEEVGRTLIVTAENASDKCNCTESLPVVLNGVEILPSCGNAGAEAERTLTVIVPTQEGLCDKDSMHQEVKPTREGASTSVGAEEAAEPIHSNKEIVGNMGQDESNKLADSLDGGQQLDSVEANKQVSCTTLADSLEDPACKEEVAVASIVELTGGSVASLLDREMSGTVDRIQVVPVPDDGDLTHMADSGNTKNEMAISGNVTELKIEETDGLSAVELSVQKSLQVERDGKNVPLTNSAPTNGGESTVKCENMVVEVRTGLSGEHIMLAEVDFTAPEVTEPCREGHGSAKVSHDTEIQTESAGQESEHEIQCLLSQGGEKVTVCDTENSSKDTEDSFSKNESTSGSDTGCSEKPEPADCKTGVLLTTNELWPLVNPDCSAASSNTGYELEGSSVQPVLTGIVQQLVQKQTITACNSGTEQELPCLTGDLSLEPSARDFVQPEVAQEMELGFVSFLSENQHKPNAESRTAAPLAGVEAPLQSEDEVSTFNKSKHVQDGLTDTPSRLPNNPCEVNQEVDTQAADFTEQGSVRIANALSAACQEEKELQEQSPSLPAVSEGNKPKQVLCETGAPISDKLLSHTGLESPALIQGPEPDMKRGAPADAGLEQGVSNEETDSVLAVDVKEGATNDVTASTTDVLQAAGNVNTLGSNSEEECSLVQSLDVISLRDVLPESTAALVDREGVCEALDGLPSVDNAEEEEEEEDDESESVTISRASLHPIAEEPLSDSDTSADMTSSSSESDSSPVVKEFTCHLLKEEDDGSDRSNQAQNAMLSPSETTPEFTLPHGENASVMSFVKDLIGSVEAEDSINTTSMLTGKEPEPLLDMPGVCTAAASAADSTSPEEDLQSMSLSEPISPGILAASSKGEGDSGLELSEQIDDDLTSPGGEELESVKESLDMKCQDEVDFAAGLQTLAERDHLINRDSWCSIEPCPGPHLLQPKHTSDPTECESFLEDGLGSESTSSHRDFPHNSGSDSDIFHMSGEGMDDMVFVKTEEEHSAGDITSSSSSADDTTSLERTSSRGSDISLPRTFHAKKNKNRHSVDSSCSSTTTPGTEGRENGETEPTETEGEEMDSITEVPLQASLSRHSMRSLSPFRRHSWGPGKNAGSDTEINQRSYSLEGLSGDGNDKNLSQTSEPVSLSSKELNQPPPTSGDNCNSFLYLNKGDLEAKQRESRASERLERSRMKTRGLSYSTSALSPPLTKSMSLVTIHQPGLENQGRTRPKRRISFSFIIPPLVPKSKNVYSVGSSSSDEESDSTRSLNSTSSSLAQSISEEGCNLQPPSPSRKDLEFKGGTKVSRTFSYIKNKMSSKKTKEKEKDKDKTKEKDKDCKEKEKDKKTLNGHHFTTTPIVGPMNCQSCLKPVTCKDSYLCSYCNSIVHKGCRESYTSCAMVKMKQTKVLQPHDTSSLPTVVMRNKSSQPKERPRSAIVAPDENTFPMLYSSNRRPQTTMSLSKSVSIQNIAGAGNEENHLNTNRYLSRSTDSLNKMNSKVTESTESLNDEGTDMYEGQLMGDFEMDSKQLEAESWSQVVDSKFLRQQKKDVVKRQDVIYELMQTEMHHVRTLKIMSDVYSRGMATELQFEPHMVEKIFPCLDDLLKIHNQFFQHILDRKRESMVESSDNNFVIKRIGDLLVNQFSGENADRMKKIYGKFCGHHNEAVNYYKDLHTKEKRFQAFMKKKMSSSVVRRLGIPECILLVTQRITKYPVLLQRILQYTKENDVDHTDLAQSLILVKDVITAVNSKVNNYEKKMRLHEIYSRTDSKSIQRMKSGKMFAKEDLKRRKLVRDGPVFLKTAANRLKEVQAVLLSDTLVFLQEKDQKYVFASLEQKSTVISLKRLIVRDVAHEEKGLFLISMGDTDPEMVEVHASSKDERNSWMQVIQDTMNTMGKDEDEGIPSESEEERKMMDMRAKELKEQLQQKDKQILTLLDEKENIFRHLCCGQDDGAQDLISRGLFRASSESLKGEELVKTAIMEVESLQGMVSSNLGGTLGHQLTSSTEPGVVGPVSLPRRAETFGGFDSHQMTSLKNGEKDEVDENLDLRRTESDGVLKKGGNGNFMLLLKRNSEQVLCSVSYLHELLSTLQAVVVQQDSYIEDQKMVLNERTISRTLSKPNSLIEQEKQRSLEKQRQELTNLKKQQAQHLEEKRKREREWEARERELAEREARIAQREELAAKGLQELEKEREELQARKEEYQRDLERLRAAQKQLEKETEQLKRDMEQDSQSDKIARTSSMATEPSKQPNSSSPKHDHLEPVSPKKEGLFRTDSKQKGKGPFHLLSTTNQTNKPTDRLFNLSKPKEKKEKKKKSKGGRSEPGGDCPPSETGQESEEIFC